MRIFPPTVETAWNSEIETWKHRTKDTHRKNKLHPRFVIEETAKRLDPAAFVVTDVGQHQIWTAQYYPFVRPRSFLTSGGLGTMGFGMGAAEGAAAANPDKAVVLFTGDGCFRMNCAEMATMVYYGFPVLIILFNNGVLGMVRQWQCFFNDGRYSQTSLAGRGPDFVKLCAAYGVPAFRAGNEAEFLAALEQSLEWTAKKMPALIEVSIDKDERVLPMVPGGKPIDEQLFGPSPP
ncbi:hypothetical protein FACS1894200_02360 [Spirochaetia bacterium]|nr:hypothetical protein FACS1894200_02360 [Spirochaetia bacterium]